MSGTAAPCAASSFLKAAEPQSSRGNSLLAIMRRKDKFDASPFPEGHGAREMNCIERLDDRRHGSGCSLDNGSSQADSLDRSLDSNQFLDRRGTLVIIIKTAQPKPINGPPAFDSE